MPDHKKIISLFMGQIDQIADDHNILSWIIIRLTGIVFLAAFISFGVQAQGLIGSHGILPLAPFMDMLRERLGAERFYAIPMIFWLTGAQDGAIAGVWLAGAVFSALVVADIGPRFFLPVITALYLSLVYAGQRFMTYQWDLLLVEVGFLAFILSLHRGMGILLFRWLAFRFIFMSGIVKIASGDAAWWDMSALDYHFLTQPLPTPLAWYADKLPSAILSAGTAVTLLIELPLAFFVLGPRLFRFIGVGGFFLLQIIISLTGNYNFFNLTAMILCLALLDDKALTSVAPKKVTGFIKQRSALIKPHRAVTIIVGIVALWTVAASLIQAPARQGANVPEAIRIIDQALEPLHIVNSYGPFAVMTKRRMEIVIEGSDDGVNWKEYGFIYKPGDVTRRPLWNIPHQPRLDWQMWFAALDTPRNNPWFLNFLQRLLEGQPDVLALLAYNPFPDGPPVFVRAAFYDYRFTTFDERRETGASWHRHQEGFYFPEVSLRK